MPRIVTLAILVLVLGFYACRHDAPTAPDGAAPPTSAIHPELAGFAVALQDVRARILPTFGDRPVFDALASSLGDVEGALSAPDPAALEGALVRANASATELSADTTLLPDLDVVLLVLQHIAAAARAPAAFVADAPPEPSDPRSEP